MGCITEIRLNFHCSLVEKDSSFEFDSIDRIVKFHAISPSIEATGFYGVLEQKMRRKIFARQVEDQPYSFKEASEGMLCSSF